MLFVQFRVQEYHTVFIISYFMALNVQYYAYYNDK